MDRRPNPGHGRQIPTATRPVLCKMTCDGMDGTSDICTASEPVGNIVPLSPLIAHRETRDTAIRTKIAAIDRSQSPHAITISRTLAGVPYEQLQGALTGWVSCVVAGQELDASVDGKWAKQSEDAQGSPLVMVNVLAQPMT